LSIGRLNLEEGGVIRDCRLAVATFGEPPPESDNAILVTTWYAGSHQAWRDSHIGPGHALDPDQHFIVVIDQIGGGLSTSPHNAAGSNASIAMSNFPNVRLGDDVVA
jgi:homoserine O-acetyltransferase/O-succinyltransferase